jgi:hypothetical protein
VQPVVPVLLGSIEIVVNGNDADVEVHGRLDQFAAGGLVPKKPTTVLAQQQVRPALVDQFADAVDSRPRDQLAGHLGV